MILIIYNKKYKRVTCKYPLHIKGNFQFVPLIFEKPTTTPASLVKIFNYSF